ncbi:MAG: hypothetical protein CMA27_03495, partial [Euryarchaeota archaeon]|nr:hypothetical protein [Euryarchaeota archaeon]
LVNNFFPYPINPWYGFVSIVFFLYLMRTIIYFGPIKIIYRELRDQKIIGEVNEVKKESKIDLKNTIKTVSEIIFVELAFLSMPIIMWMLYRYNFRSEMILELNPWSLNSISIFFIGLIPWLLYTIKGDFSLRNTIKGLGNSLKKGKLKDALMGIGFVDKGIKGLETAEKFRILPSIGKKISLSNAFRTILNKAADHEIQKNLDGVKRYKNTNILQWAFTIIMALFHTIWPLLLLEIIILGA